MAHVALLLGCALVIYLACEWFVNAVEWLGVRLRVGPIAVGTILAAAGTALPESVVTLVAVVSGSRQGARIGVGAALGGPLVVGTLAYAVMGVMLLLTGARAPAQARGVLAGSVAAGSVPAGSVPAGSVPAGGVSAGSTPAAVDTALASAADPRRPARDGLDRVDRRRLGRDQTWFLAVFVVTFGLGLVAFAIKPWLGLAFFAVYGLYVGREVRDQDEVATGEGLEPLRLQPRRATPTTAAVVAQTLTTLALIFGASQLFVTQLEWAGPALGLPAVVVALLLSPIATELPEIMNAIIWVRQGKTELAAANISGAMMIQATVPSGIGILFTAWRFDTPLILASVATLGSVLYLNAIFRMGRVTAAGLAAAGIFYLGFAAALVVWLHTAGTLG